MKLDVSQPKVLHPRLDGFRKRFSEAHLHLAYHAALPLALTPDLLYRLWANFQQDVQSEMLNIPWVAVADLLLSSLCEEVGHELYEMDRSVRAALLEQLKHDDRFGQPRLHELSDFLLTYVQQQLDSPDIDTRDRAEAQRWAAIAYTQPGIAAQELSRILASTYQHDKTECLRVAAIVETLAEPLAAFEPLLTDARTKATAVRSGVTAPTPPKSRKVLYWAISIIGAAILAGLAYRILTPKPDVTPSPTPAPSYPSGSPPASPSPSLPTPAVTTPAAGALPSPSASTPPDSARKNLPVSPSFTPPGAARQTLPVPLNSPAPQPTTSTPAPSTPTPLPEVPPYLPEPSPSPPPNSPCLTFKCTDVPDPSTGRGGATR